MTKRKASPAELIERYLAVFHAANPGSNPPSIEYKDGFYHVAHNSYTGKHRAAIIYQWMKCLNERIAHKA